MEYDNATIILGKELYNKLVLKKDIIVTSNLITKEISKLFNNWLCCNSYLHNIGYSIWFENSFC